MSARRMKCFSSVSSWPLFPDLWPLFPDPCSPTPVPEPCFLTPGPWPLFPDPCFRDLAFFHRSADLRLRAVDRVHAGRRGGRVHAAGGAISRRHPAHGRWSRAIYPGANAQTVRDTVAAPIEEQVSGVEGMMYMSSQCTNDGAYTLMVTFKLGMDSDMAQVLVQNRVSLALPVIPQLVQNEGINVKKMSPNTMMIVNLISPDRPLRQHLSQQLRHDLYQGRIGPACPASPTSPTWASAITACGPGSIPTSWPR